MWLGKLKFGLLTSLTIWFISMVINSWGPINNSNV